VNSDSRDLPVHTQKRTSFCLSLLSVLVLFSCSLNPENAPLQEKDLEEEPGKPNAAPQPEAAEPVVAGAATLVGAGTPQSCTEAEFKAKCDMGAFESK
jgi:hypothetical protein